MKPCKNPVCKNTVTYGRCSPCQRYFRKHAVERPAEWCEKMYYRHSESRPRKCKVCKSPKVAAYGRCDPCRVYWDRHGTPRPRYLWDKNCPCATCGVPLGSVPVGRRRKGRCGPCAAYFHYHKGKERPRHLWGIGPAGWCACGFPAVIVASEGKPVCVRHRE
jgi:hypothetical protein